MTANPQPAWKAPKVCECGCGVEYEPSRPWQKFAAKACREHHWSKIRAQVYELVKGRALE